MLATIIVRSLDFVLRETLEELLKRETGSVGPREEAGGPLGVSHQVQLSEDGGLGHGAMESGYQWSLVTGGSWRDPGVGVGGWRSGLWVGLGHPRDLFIHTTPASVQPGPSPTAGADPLCKVLPGWARQPWMEGTGSSL